MSYYSINRWGYLGPKNGTLQYPAHFIRYTLGSKSNEYYRNGSYAWTAHDCDSPCLCCPDGSIDTYLRGLRYQREDARDWDLKGYSQDTAITEETAMDYIHRCHLKFSNIYISKDKTHIYQAVDIGYMIIYFKNRASDIVKSLINYKPKMKLIT